MGFLRLSSFGPYFSSSASLINKARGKCNQSYSQGISRFDSCPLLKALKINNTQELCGELITTVMDISMHWKVPVK